ncbi:MULTISPECIES: ribonuclease Y [Breznakia]|uniref:Ribonuclease Y n=1 Tax=Breznakia blatticola TaxID=1754012 RepID=A0A4R8A288_9FIRM|nr:MULTISPECIES: ribonuclease Y [Breznakia]MDH6367208.1 ribonuclease Y [Breznakia sp. PH1-1]MDH6404372.1 ribonuclease Y [Breznakia sp. PF1-11]MDH6412081.1 ribonuclease Y [Breznakia sp. PFB1-11]MDH6414360.1 ribonuclease Y [Breznakia sp. PFB1-14]MDH6416710.1 ribonuclease Y [Breznakia sp. PFB1-4]
MDVTTILLSGVIGLIIGIAIMAIAGKMGLTKSEQQAKLTIQEAESKAESTIKQAVLEGKTQAHELKLNAEKEIKAQESKLLEKENSLIRKEDSLNFRDEALVSKEVQLEKKNTQLSERMSALDKKEAELEKQIDSQVEELERIAAMTSQQAKDELFSIIEKRMDNEVLSYIKEREDEAKSTADEKARNIIALSVQRLSQEEAADRMVSVVNLPSEEMKGRIIGREGRNIKAIEQATGVDLNIDDTPEVITLSCFDPIRREVARQALESLIKDGRIQPGRIEEVVRKVRKDMDQSILKAGEDAIFRLGIGKMDKDMIRLIGKLKYRYSYGQNALQHSMEVAELTGMMAAELGLNQVLAKRAGLLHDLGKAIDYEVDGSHVELGYKFAKKHGEDEVVLNAIQSHHGDAEPKYLISNLVYAADTLSAARPGARKEQMQNYIKRLEDLERISKSFDGVESTYAIQAGREIRVFVAPDQIDDLKAVKLARELKDKIEAELTYPGQIKVTVIRETRANEIAK